jgi:hypothetical protein
MQHTSLDDVSFQGVPLEIDRNGCITLPFASLVNLAADLRCSVNDLIDDGAIWFNPNDMVEVGSDGHKNSVTFDLSPQDAYAVLEGLSILVEDDEDFDTAYEVVQDAIDVYKAN